MEIVLINKSNRFLIKDFLATAGKSLVNFRYFNSRTVDVLDNHIVTYVFKEGNEVTAYGHLDKENEVVWLGIAVAQNHQGKGLGKLMMQTLVAFAKTKKLNEIQLAVDGVNKRAIKLYQNFGFETFKKTEQVDFLKLSLQQIKAALDIYISTIAFAGKQIEEAIAIAISANYQLEFSSGLPYNPKNLAFIDAYPLEKLAHNYFPAPEIPFVLNLASKNDNIRRQSIEHCVQGLNITKNAGANFFAAHAGFCIDPAPGELGKKLTQTNDLIDRDLHFALFLKSIIEVLKTAEKLDIEFYIENNVTAKMNLNVHDQNPLLCSEPDEMLKMVSTINHPKFGILLDTAHLKVSSNTLGFKLKEGMELLKTHIKAIHHSDNDGILDSNQSIQNDYWFARFVREFRNLPHVLEVRSITKDQIDAQINLLNKFADN